MVLTFQDEETVRKIVHEEVKGEVKSQLTQFRSDILNAVDVVLTEIKASREDQTIHSGQHEEIHDKFEEYDKNLSLINGKLNLT